ncbi:E3 ubiquitin-protein ligase TRAIP [Penaeus vannamei]|uniref:E3 ubiquitin-protein ligase TRAIP n=1 Tax=Penaeus vannamei TaxID=6689 RepID=UPI00387FA17F
MRAACVICGDLFIHTDDISATPCGHTFHTVCLIQWIERSKSCPQCRHKATEKSLVKLFFDSGGADTSHVDPDTLQHQIDSLKFQIRLKEQEMKNFKDNSETLTKQNKGLREECKTITSQLHAKDTTIMALKSQLQFMDRITKEAQKAKEEAKKLREQLRVLQNVESIVSGTNDDVEAMLVSYSNNPDSTRALATFCSILKKEMNKTVDDKRRFRDEATSLRNKLREVKHSYNIASNELTTVQQTNKNLQDDVMSLEKENKSLMKKMEALQQAIVSPSGDVKNSALHRLIAESPAPADLKRPRLSSPDEEDLMITPEVVRKMSRSEQVTPPDESFEIVGSQDSTTPPMKGSPSKSKFVFQIVLFPGRRPLAVTTNISNKSKQHHNIFAKNKPTLQNIGMSSQLNSQGSGTQIGYDGLGGHHKVDEFPKPRPVLLKKKSVKVVTKGGSAARVQSTTLKNFFQNTFDD